MLADGHIVIEFGMRPGIWPDRLAPLAAGRPRVVRGTPAQRSFAEAWSTGRANIPQTRTSPDGRGLHFDRYA